MRGYKVIKEDHNHIVYETYNNIKLKTFKGHDSEARAKELARHLNLGGGFDGYTPDFFKENNATYVIAL